MSPWRPVFCFVLMGELRVPANVSSLSTSSLKVIVQRALAELPCMLVFNHLAGPSRVVTGMIRNFTDYGNRPIYLAARTPHMEDVGTLQPLSADRSERLEIRNLAPAVALEFAREKPNESACRLRTSKRLCTLSSNGVREIPGAFCRC
jgi:hypothetical protein